MSIPVNTHRKRRGPAARRTHSLWATALALTAAIGCGGALPPVSEEPSATIIGEVLANDAAEGAAKSEVMAAAAARALDPIGDNGRASISQKGSLLFYPHVEVKWDAAGVLTQDTFIQFFNDYPDDVSVQFYFVNGDAPVDALYVADQLVERAHEGWNWVDVQFRMTGNQPAYWSAATGAPLSVSPISVLDPIDPVGRLDTDPGNRGGRVIRGFLIGWAVSASGQEIRWNHLSGGATLIHYREQSAWEYSAWAFQAHGVGQEEQTASCTVFNMDTGRCLETAIAPGRIDLDGYEYDACPARLQMQFPTTSTTPGRFGLGIDALLTLATVGNDLRQDTQGPTTTKAKFDIWNQNEIRFSGTEKCITCWDHSALKDFTSFGVPNHFLQSSVQTDMARARINGMGSKVCPNSVDAPLLGVLQKRMYFLAEQQIMAPLIKLERSGMEIGGQGEEVARILYDIIEGPEEANRGDGG